MTPDEVRACTDVWQLTDYLDEEVRAQAHPTSSLDLFATLTGVHRALALLLENVLSTPLALMIMKEIALRGGVLHLADEIPQNGQG